MCFAQPPLSEEAPSSDELGLVLKSFSLGQLAVMGSEENYVLS